VARDHLRLPEERAATSSIAGMEMAQADRDLIDAEGMDEEHGSRIVLVLVNFKTKSWQETD
jgi:hypothetical protein